MLTIEALTEKVLAAIEEVEILEYQARRLYETVITLNLYMQDFDTQRIKDARYSLTLKITELRQAAHKMVTEWIEALDDSDEKGIDSGSDLIDRIWLSK